MNPPTTVPDSPPFASEVTAPVDGPTRPLYWSVRRELWENRSLYVVPLIVTAFVLLGSLIRLLHPARTLPDSVANLPDGLPSLLIQPFRAAPAPIILATFLVGIFYSLDALYGERRNRSLLFWKSLPVSDRTTVLSKASIPLVVLPVFGFLLSLATLLVLLSASLAVLLAKGTSPGRFWDALQFFQQPVIMLYGLAVHVLWFAPIYSWLLLVSAWARRLPVLWAGLPLVAVSVVERMAFGSSHFAFLLRYRVIGPMGEAFTLEARDGDVDRLSQLDPGRFLSSPGLWLGLAVAAAFLAAAVRIRRRREPL